MLKKSLLSLAVVLFLSSLFIPGAFSFTGQSCMPNGKLNVHCANATRYIGETGYIYVYIDNYTASCHGYTTLAYFTYYHGYYFTLGNGNCDESIYTLDGILSNN